MINVSEIIDFFYPEESDLKQMLLKHSIQVKNKALEILDESENLNLYIDRDIVINGAMLHDIGIRYCNAPSIFCYGEHNYICHGVIGADLLRQYSKNNQINLEQFARICERHTGSGLSAFEIREQNIPIPEKDFIPETLEEKLVCLADKFYSKSGSMEEKPLSKVRESLMKFGIDTISRFDDMCDIFHIKN